MSALFSQSTFVKNEDTIRVPQGRESVGDRDHSDPGVIGIDRCSDVDRASVPQVGHCRSTRGPSERDDGRVWTGLVGISVTQCTRAGADPSGCLAMDT